MQHLVFGTKRNYFVGNVACWIYCIYQKCWNNNTFEKLNLIKEEEVE